MRNLKSSEIASVRATILKEQGYRCPLCGKEITEKDKITLDHQHKVRKSDPNGVDGNGQIRGVLCLECNALEGKIYNACTRFLHQPTKEQRIQFLLNLVAYYQQEPYPLIHPSEVPPEPKLSKRNFNKLKKLYESKYHKPLEFPKSGKMVKKLEPLYKEFNINPYNT